LKKYGIREVFGTLQGEGRNAGAPAVFLRFAGCNLGYDVCPWCDTDWAKAHHNVGLPGVLELVEREATATFSQMRAGLFLVATGGEPSLQMDTELADGLRGLGFTLAMESNGSRAIAPGITDWLTVSPKQKDFIQKSGNELKIVFTGQVATGIAVDEDAVIELSDGTSFEHYYLQPVDLGPDVGSNFDETIRAVMRLGPPWRLSAQVHKVVGIR
jgi:7-carboxy-7-deazaguanine synthase